MSWTEPRTSDIIRIFRGSFPTWMRGRKKKEKHEALFTWLQPHLSESAKRSFPISLSTLIIFKSDKKPVVFTLSLTHTSFLVLGRSNNTKASCHPKAKTTTTTRKRSPIPRVPRFPTTKSWRMLERFILVRISLAKDLFWRRPQGVVAPATMTSRFSHTTLPHRPLFKQTLLRHGEKDLLPMSNVPLWHTGSKKWPTSIKRLWLSLSWCSLPLSLQH